MDSIPFPVLLLAKATLIFIMGGTGATALRNRSASVRRTVWALTLAAAASLPIGMVAIPAWRVAVPSKAELPSRIADLSEQTVRSVTRPISRAAVIAKAGTASLPAEYGSAKAGVELPSAGILILIVWGIGAAALVARVLIGFAGLRIVSRRANAVLPQTWRNGIANEQRLMQIDRDVKVLISPAVATPLTFGIVSPTILLPEESCTWTDEHRNVVIRHEMAHIASGDTTICFAAALACALYWFHPLAWVASRKLRQEQERACDDRVLTLGTPATEYAAHLLEVARSAREIGMKGLVSFAMARPTQLEGRLLAVLNETAQRAHLTTRARLTGYAMTTVFVLGLSAFSLEARAMKAAVTRSAASLVAELTPDSVVVQEIRTESGGQLILDLKTGAGVTITGTDEPVIRMRASLGGKDWRNTDIRLTKTSAGARVDSRYIEQHSNRSASHRVELWMPRRYDVLIRSAGGGVNIRDMDGNFSGSTGGGEIRIEGAEGTARITTGGGGILVKNSTLDGSVSTGAGSVLIQGGSGNLRGSSGTGDVLYGKNGLTYSEATVEGGGRRGSDGRYYINKAGGGITLARAENGAEVSTGGGAITIGNAGGDLKANTGAGDISVATLTGSGTLTTGAGDVKVTVAGAGTHAVRVTSGNGRVTLYLPSDISALLDIETAYTENHRPTRIDSDWDISTTETGTWDSTEGSPRRYVRARGTIGSAEGRITVKTVNGDVLIRRSR
jgi:beta-lactamase regulating signal transducer with metallopeptidase domain/DUF4097 and DUF4098 domain-containing protein YvlB